VIAAYMPVLLIGGGRDGGGPGWQFQLALEVLQQLAQARSSARHGRSLPELAHQLRLDPLQLEPVLEILVGLNWIGRINEIEDEERTRYLLLADPESTALEPLLRNLLLADSDATATLWKASRLADVALKDVV
jgi:membrane protein